MSKLKFLVALLLFFSSIAYADSNYYWMAMSLPTSQKSSLVPGKRSNFLLTNHDIYRYLEATKMPQYIKRRLFRKSKSYDEYLEKKNKWIHHNLKKYYTKTLRLLTWYGIIQHYATSNKIMRKNKFFLISVGDMKKRLKLLEKRILKPIIKDIRKKHPNLSPFEVYIEATKAYAKLLRDNNYPYRRDDSLDKIYAIWLSEQRYLLIEQILMEEVRKTQIFAAKRLEHLNPQNGLILNPSPKDLYRFYQRESSKFNELITNGRTSQKIIETIKKRPRLQVVAKYIEGGSSFTISTSKLRQDHPHLFIQVQSAFLKRLTPYLSKSTVKKIINYEKGSHILAKKYGDDKILYRKAKASLAKFYKTGNYRMLMMSKLYDLSASLIKNKLTQKNFSKMISDSLVPSFNSIKSKLQADKTYQQKEYRSKGIAQIAKAIIEREVKNNLKRHIEKNKQHLNHQRKIASMILWIMSFYVKKITVLNKNMILIGQIDDFNNAQNRIKKYIYQQKLARGVKRFHQQLLQSGNKPFNGAYQEIVQLNPTGEKSLSPQEIRKFLLVKKPKK